MAAESNVASAPADASKKRKRSTPAAEELEIDVNLPEPPSKKALRRAKKGKSASSTKTSLKDRSDLQDDEPGTTTEITGKSTKDSDGKPEIDTKAAAPKRSEHGIWIGNLGFHVTPAILSEFLCEKASLKPEQLTRINLPLGSKVLPTYMQRKSSDAKAPKQQMQNKGFAYVDLDTPEALFQVLQVSEQDLDGRKVLIKDAKSFAGRPDPPPAASGKTDAKGAKESKPRNKRVFVGNLPFEATKEDLEQLFSQAGQVEIVFLATFEDTGKCKGFGYVTFADEDAAEKAVNRWVWKVDDDAGGDDEEDVADDDAAAEDDESEGSDAGAQDSKQNALKGTKNAKAKAKSLKPTKRKWWINTLHGRRLRCEFAEDATTRYKKRYGKEGTKEMGGRPARGGDDAVVEATDGGSGGGRDREKRSRGTADERQEARRQKHRDARKIAPGQALANAPRQSGAILRGQGKKITFE